MDASHTTQNTNTNRWARNSSNVEPLKPCRDGFDCIPHHNGNAEHNARYSHPCQWLDLCRDINENEHSRHYTHPIDAIDVCQYGTANCTKLGDPEHRRTYRHVGLPYLLVPCKYGSRCEDRSTEHLKKFKHPPDFYQETNFNTASNVSNTKQECRYGANCRDQSDPTHRDRFQHPTKTSSLFVPATTSSQSSNTNSNTARSSRFHNIRGDDDDIEREHNIGGAMNSGRSSIQDQTTIKNTHQDTVSSFSSTKQECKYGANCRDQSDPTHLDKERVKVLIRSQALKDKYHSDAVIVTFDCGQGNVTHMISHFYLQRSETANARHKMPAQQYAQDIKASDNITKLITKDGQNLNYAQIQSSSTSAQFVYNLISNRLNSTNKSTSSTNSRKDFQ
ncbi:unnamed protein product [Rotaria sordida]|uniref:PBZ-type domain-containing protein n=1 Tax=Rotaria sordida TaxID=392033 RepID=A0A813XQX6_9BILA|nr:unnamed protein product [Rotaria sordida]